MRTMAAAAWLGWAEGLAVQPDLSVSDWAAEHRILVPPDPEPGPWRNDRTPYLTGIMDVCSPEHPAKHITGMMGVQIGKTSFALNVAGWAVYTGGHSIVIGVPAEADAKEWSARLMSMLSASGSANSQLFESRGPKKAGQMSTRMLYRANGTQIKFGWAGSPRTFAMTQASIVIGDEVDRWTVRKKEGAPEDLLANRATTAGRPKIILISSPVVESVSRIYAKFREGDQRLFFVPCPHCGHYQTLEWDRMVWPRRPDYQETAGQHLARCSEIAMRCVACDQMIQERTKGQFLTSGIWLATQGREDFATRGFAGGDLQAMAPIFSEMGRAVYVSFQLSSLYAPWGWKGASWPDLAMAWERAKGDTEKYKAFVTTRLARPWKDNAQRPEAETIAEMRRLDYQEGTVPTGAAVLTVAVDVQPDRLEYEVLGHGRQGATWSVEYDVIYGNIMMAEPWEKLRAVLYRTWPTEGGATLGVSAMAVDTGFMPERAYAFALREARPHVSSGGYQLDHQRTVVLMKGATRGWTREIESYSPYESAQKRGGLYIFHAGTSFLKARLYEHLRAEPGAVGQCWFPRNRELPYFHGLVAEECLQERGKMVWTKVGAARNEPLDCRVYNMAAGHMLRLHAWTDARWEKEISKTIRTQHATKPPTRERFQVAAAMDTDGY